MCQNVSECVRIFRIGVDTSTNLDLVDPVWWFGSRCFECMGASLRCATTMRNEIQKKLEEMTEIWQIMRVDFEDIWKKVHPGHHSRSHRAKWIFLNHCGSRRKEEIVAESFTYSILWSTKHLISTFSKQKRGCGSMFPRKGSDSEAISLMGIFYGWNHHNQRISAKQSASLDV